MNKLRRVGLASAVGIALISLTGIGSVATAGTASAAPKVSSFELKGLTFVEADVTVPAGGESPDTIALCPGSDTLVGGGAYEVTQGLGQDLAVSDPNSVRAWEAVFNNQGSVSNTGVVVSICAHTFASTVVYGNAVTVPPDSQAQVVVTCPSGTVAVGGGGSSEGGGPYGAVDASAPYGTNGWRAYLSTGRESDSGDATVICATKPTGWTQVSSAYKSNPAETATNVNVKCPAGKYVLSGGPFNSSTSPEVTIGLTTSMGNLEGWHSVEDNASSADESVDEWAVCATAKRASS